MKTKIVLPALAFVAFCCQNKPSETPAQSPAETVTIPVEYTYKGNATIGDMKNVAVVAECNKRLGEHNADIGEFVADSLHWVMADGTEVRMAHDSAVAFIKDFVENTTSIKVTFITQIPVNNTEQNHEWVLSWSDETYTFKDGKVEHGIFHEDYRMENGKIREIFQYKQQVP
jgi:hypothetical protein